MLKKRLQIILNIILFLTLAASVNAVKGKALMGEADSAKIYLVKNYWHVGIIFPLDIRTTKILPVLNDFKGFHGIEIGWGDEDFYQNPTIDYYNATKAALLPTNSVIRLRGINGNLESFFQSSDFCIELKISYRAYVELLEYIKESFYFGSKNSLILVGDQLGGQIRFYRSRKKYHLFHTCNTWVVRGLEDAELSVSSFGVITAEHLFKEVRKIGVVLKEETDG